MPGCWFQRGITWTRNHCTADSFAQSYRRAQSRTPLPFLDEEMPVIIETRSQGDRWVLSDNGVRWSKGEHRSSNKKLHAAAERTSYLDAPASPQRIPKHLSLNILPWISQHGYFVYSKTRLMLIWLMEAFQFAFRFKNVLPRFFKR